MELEPNEERFSRPFIVQAYDPDWVRQYSARAEKLKAIFGSELVAVEHIGSTAIPGMVAKPQIDILVLVRDFHKVRDFYPAMEAAGFTPRGTQYLNIGDEYFTEDAPDGRRLASIHIFPEGDPARERYLNFRDYLHTHPEDRDLYSSVKQRVKEAGGDYEAYVRGKEDTILDIQKRADDWAARYASD